MGKVKDQLWDEWEAEQKYSDFMDTTLVDSDYAYDMNDDWIISPTEDICGIGISTLDNTNVYYDVDEQRIAQQVGPDVLQKINKEVEEMGGAFYDEIPF